MHKHLFTTTVTFLLNTDLEASNTLQQLECALFVGCADLENNNVEPTFKIGEIKEI